jgi:hypothetical protein
MLLPVIAFSQDCKLHQEKDPYTKEVKIATGFFNLKTYPVSIQATKTEIDFLFSLGPNICYDDAATAVIQYEGTRMKTNMKNGGTTNCDGLFHFTFRNMATTPYALQNMGQKKITSVKFKDNAKNEIEITLSPEEQKIFMDWVNCMIPASKTLIPAQ